MRQPWPVAVSFALSLIVFMSPASAETITLAGSIPFSEFSGATDKVKNECKFQTRLPAYVKSAAKRKVDVVLSKDSLDDVDGKILVLEITNVYAPGGGGYSGSKNATVSGELKENGEVIGSFTARRRTLIGMMPGTCSMLKRVSKKLGEDIAGWLRAPTMEATLGDLEDEEED
jgi:hypothetical protein